jgi:competence protein ComEC
MKYFKKYSPYILIISIFIFCVGVTYLVFLNFNSKYLKVVFLDVGQGDAIYIEAPNKTQILIDGGPDQGIVPRLSRVMPFGDRSIDLLVSTHADSDHVGGLPSVVDYYKVNGILENGASSDTNIYKSLEDKVLEKNIKKIIAQAGTKIFLDKEKNIYFEVLFPDRDVSQMESNDGSIIGRLVYGNKSFLFTGDAEMYSEVVLSSKMGNNLRSNILKLGHHGSRTSSSLLWLENVMPDLAIVSSSKNNRYGHPHKETIDRLLKLNIPYLNTAQIGNIVFKTDGVNLIIK